MGYSPKGHTTKATWRTHRQLSRARLRHSGLPHFNVYAYGAGVSHENPGSGEQTSVKVSSCCHHKHAVAWWHKHRNALFHRSGSWKSEARVPVHLGSGESS